jgi:hypothetical protein
MGTREETFSETQIWDSLRSLIDTEREPNVSDEALVNAAIQGEVVALVSDLYPPLATSLAPIIEREVFVSLQLDRALNVAVEALDEAEVPKPVIVKGCAAARLVYENPSHRIGVDVDLLVAEEDFDRTLEVLGEAGFRSATSQGLLKRHGPRAWEEELAWVTTGGSVSLDVHRKLAASERFKVDHKGILARAVAHDALPWAISHPEDTLLHTALHMATNRFWVPLKSWIDVRRLLAHEDVDLDRVLERAARWKMRTSLWTVLWVCARWFPGSVPEASLRRVEPPLGVRHVLRAGLSGDGHRPIKGDPRGTVSQLWYGPLLSDDLPAVARWLRESAIQTKRMAIGSKAR